MKYHLCSIQKINQDNVSTSCSKILLCPILRTLPSLSFSPPHRTTSPHTHSSPTPNHQVLPSHAWPSNPFVVLIGPSHPPSHPSPFQNKNGARYHLTPLYHLFLKSFPSSPISVCPFYSTGYYQCSLYIEFGLSNR